MYLLDTNVLSASAPAKAQHTPELIRWMECHSNTLYLSVITVAEVEDGIAKARRQGAAQKADRLAAWLETLLHLHSARILPLDVAVARRLGTLSDRARAAGLEPGWADLAIAATAANRGYTVLTRNLRHFRDLPVSAHDPFESLPAVIG
ncbi:PIN domain-containing protein [Lichenicoccus sp.]|uniref:PIN domain-containing protein n=1 Tax=Lichenicoccus sp. TaxID=2781899 RepID=UPI003D09CDFD